MSAITGAITLKMKGTPNSGNQHRVEGSMREVISQLRAYRSLSKRREICAEGEKGENFQRIEAGTTWRKLKIVQWAVIDLSVQSVRDQTEVIS